MDIKCLRCGKLLAKINEHENQETEVKIEWICVRCKKFNKALIKIIKFNPVSA